MKSLFKKLFLVFLICFFPSFVWASPFLISASIPTTGIQPTYYTVSIDGAAAVNSTPLVNGDSSVELHYDLTVVAAGAHTVAVAACNLWGCSSTTPFSFTRSAPVIPTSISISAT